jgi:hypothetical protein
LWIALPFMGLTIALRGARGMARDWGPTLADYAQRVIG